MESIDRALKEVQALCDGKEWIMHIPAQDTDPDLVISRALHEAQQRITELDAQVKALREIAGELVKHDPILDTPWGQIQCNHCEGSWFRGNEPNHDERCPVRRLAEVG